MQDLIVRLRSRLKGGTHYALLGKVMALRKEAVGKSPKVTNSIAGGEAKRNPRNEV